MPGPFLCASPSSEDPLSLGYGVSLPNSLTVSLPSALVYSTRPRVSVYGTGRAALGLSGFSGEYGYLHSRTAPGGSPYCRVSARGVCFTAPLGTYALQPPVPSGGGSVTAPSPRRTLHELRNVDRIAIAICTRIRLRTRLTRRRLASPRKPWPYGGRASHPPYRYLYLHLPFQTLQHASRQAFNADWNAPLPIRLRIPRLRHAA